MARHADSTPGVSGRGAAGPGPTSDRILFIDALRGFALLGVAVSNFTWTAHWIATPAAMREAALGASLNSIVGLWNGTFIGHKFLTIFSMLFGVGFALMLRRIEERDERAAAFFLRRLGVLFLFGILHLAALWHGDILHIYAPLGIVLLALARVSNRVILVLAALFIVLVPACVDAWATLVFPEAGEVAAGDPRASRFAAFTGGSYPAMLLANARVYLDTQREEGLRLWSGILGRLLLGYWIGRRALLERTGEHRRLWRRIGVIGVAAGLAANVFSQVVAYTAGVNVWVSGGPWWAVLVRAALEPGHALLALGYVGLLVSLWESGRRGVLRRLAPFGRMALTNYLMQTVVMCFLLYDVGIGLGLLGRLSLAADVGIALVVCLVQAAFSGWWLRRFRFGPLEWLWRTITYGRIQPMRAS